MKKKTVLSSVLALTLCFGLLSGCGSEKPEADSGTVSAPAAEETSSAAQAPEESERASEAEENAAERTASEDEVPEKTEVELPLTAEPVTYTFWYSEPFTDYVEDPAADVAVFRLLSERTNIQFDFTLSTNDTANEKFQLLFAADDLPDIITDAMTYYSGSIDDAVQEDAFLYEYSGDLQSMPNYSAVLNTYVEAKKTITSADTGAMVAFPEIYMDVGDISGYMIRKDYLDATGMEIPQTYEELHQLLTAIYNDTGATMELLSSGGESLLGAGFGINTELSDDDLSGWYVEDGTVKLGILQDAFLDYLELVRQWYSEGLIYPDFVGTDRGDLTELFNGSYSITVKPPEIVEVANQVIGTEMAAMPMPRQTAEEPITVCGAATSCLMDKDTWSINANVKNTELLLSLIDYMYSDEGFYLINYGEEGVSYNMVDGEPEFTDLVLNNPEGLDYAHAAYLYASSNRTRLPFVSDYARCFAQYTDAQWDAVETYTDDCDHSNDYPVGAIMSTQQSSSYNTVAADICTYISENVLQFIYGQKDISEWSAFVDTLYDMNIETAIEAKQAAYDDYLNS